MPVGAEASAAGSNLNPLAASQVRHAVTDFPAPPSNHRFQEPVPAVDQVLESLQQERHRIMTLKLSRNLSVVAVVSLVASAAQATPISATALGYDLVRFGAVFWSTTRTRFSPGPA